MLSLSGVALHPEGVDRNRHRTGNGLARLAVALHPEGVDRNIVSMCAKPERELSPSTRRAWIEMDIDFLAN